jgi:hypothetical protein
VTWALAEKRDSATASRLIDEAKALGESMDCTTAGGYGPLQYVAWQMGHWGLAEQLIDAGADINRAMNANGHSPLALASVGGRTELVELLIKKGADIDGQSQLPRRCPQRSPLVAAIVNGSEGTPRKARA